MIDFKHVYSLAVSMLATVVLLTAQNVAAQEVMQNEGQQSTDGSLFGLDNLLFNDPEAAIVFLDAHRATKEGQPEFDLMYAYADYRIHDRKPRQERRLKQALDTYDAAGGPETYLLGRILTDYAAIQLDNNQGRYARETANRAEAVLTSTRPEDLRARMWPILWAGYSHTLDEPIFDSSLVDAYSEFSRARALFASQPPGNASASGEYEAIAAQAAAAGLLATRNPRAADLEKMGAVFQISEGAEIDTLCAGSLTGKAPSVARNAPDWAPHFMGRLGEGRVVAVDFDLNGHMKDFRVIAEPFPPIVHEDDKFHDRIRDKAVKKALKRWQVATGADARCYDNRLIVLTGYSRNEEDAFFNPRQVMDDLSRF